MKNMSRRHFIKLGAGSLMLGAAFTTGIIGCTGGGVSKNKIRLGYLPITDHLTVIAHAQQEYNNVELEPVKFSGWPELAEALKTGAIEAGFALTPIGLRLRQAQVPIQAVLLGHRNGSVITVKTDAGIKSVKDLKGTTVAIPSPFSTHNILIRKIMAENGLTEADVKLLDMAPPEMVQALSSKQIDGFIVAEPFGGQAELQNVGEVLMLSKEIWPEHICCVLQVQEKVIQENPDGVQELVNSLVATGTFIEGNRQEAADLSTKYLGQKAEVINHVLTSPKDRVTYNDLNPVLEDFKATQDYMLQFGITDKEVDLTKYLEPKFAKIAYGK